MLGFFKTFGSTLLQLSLLASASALLPSSDHRIQDGRIDVLHPLPNPAFWQISLNGGQIQNESGAVCLYASPSGGSYPLIQSRPTMLQGDWSLMLKFRYLSIGDRGDGISLRNIRTQHDLFRVHADRTQHGIQLWAGDAAKSIQGIWDGSPSVSLGGNPETEHSYSVSRQGETMTFVFDGHELAKAQAEPGSLELRIGSNISTYPGRWSTISLSDFELIFNGRPPHLNK